ncbi:hypothetical protein [Aeromicrobium sp.]|uniref:hypothetical protein n=1 Tax=Aeromicrobium sp. TaxID=1871063 RepID=UPI0030BF77A9
MIWNRNKGERTGHGDRRDVEHQSGTRVDPAATDDRVRDRDRDRGLDHDRDRAAYTTAEDRAAEGQQHQREEWGGMNFGAGFFGWLVAVGLAVLLSSIIGAVAAAVGDANDVTQTELERESGTISVAAAIVLVAVLMISFYAGGYVAGRMSRFDGARQGWAVWLIGLLVVVIAAIIGAVFGSEYDIMNRVEVPDVPIPTEDLTLGGAITIAATVLGTLLAALVGGKAGTHYHRKVDRTW